MPVTIKKSQLMYKNESTGEYVSVDAVADKTSQQQINGINTAASNAIASINTAMQDIDTQPLTTLPKKAYKKDLVTNEETLASAATHAYAVGDYFYVADNNNDISLYKATAAIAVGNTISPGTGVDNNCIPAALADDVTSLSNDIDTLNESLDDVKADITDSVSGYYPVLLNASANSYIDNQGKLVSYSGWKASDYIPCDGLECIHVSTTVTSNYNAYYSSKSESDFLSIFQTRVGDNVLHVPEGAKYFRLSNTNAGMNATTYIDLNATKISELKSDVINANNGYKDIGGYVFGEYVDNATGNFVASSSYKRTGYIDISDYNGSLYFKSNYRTPYCCFYNSSFEKVVSFTIYVGEALVNIPNGAAYCAFSLSRYNADITMYDSTRALVKSLRIDNIRDINLKYLPQTDTLTQMVNKPLMLVYTDIHGSDSNFDRITKFYENNVNANVWYPINLGDTVTDQATDSIAFMDTSLGSASLMVIGNHDLLVSGTLPGITAKEAYDKYIAPNVSNWDVTQPANASENGYNYYYKDRSYSGGTIRLIVLDEYFYDQTQHNWFVDALSDANTNGYSVIVCQHQSNVPSNQASALNTENAFATPELGFDLYITISGYAGEYANAAENRAMAVDTFIANGGKFVCWMSGHTHSDQCHTFTKNGRKQLSLIFSNAGMSMTSSKRIANYSADCFQYVAVDLVKHYIYVLRIGEAVDQWFHKNEFMMYDYVNHIVKEYK